MAVTLNEKSRTTNVQSTTTIGDYNYIINYNFDASKVLVSINITIQTGNNVNVGSFYKQGESNNNLNVSPEYNMVEQSTNINSILDVINSNM